MAGIFQSGLYTNGFDMDQTAAQIFTQSTNGATVQNSPTPYSFGYCCSCYGGTNGILLGTNLTTLFVGVNINLTALPGSSCVIFNFYDATAGAAQVTLRVTSTGTLQFYLGSGTGTPIGSASSVSVVANTWCYLAAKVVIAASGGGSVSCQVADSTVITQGSVTTQSTANTFVNAFQFQQSGIDMYVDDWWMLDGTGSAPFNTYIAAPWQCRGEAPIANSAVGGRNAWTGTPATGSNTYQNVAHVPANSSDYDYDSNPGDYDMFRFPNLPSNVASVLAVNEWALVGLDSSGARTVELDCYSNGTDNASAAFTPAAISSPTYYNLMNTVDPHTGSAWTVANAEAAELGMKVQS
jgi:hypothetical protein